MLSKTREITPKSPNVQQTTSLIPFTINRVKEVVIVRVSFGKSSRGNSAAARAESGSKREP